MQELPAAQRVALQEADLLTGLQQQTVPEVPGQQLGSRCGCGAGFEQHVVTQIFVQQADDPRLELSVAQQAAESGRNGLLNQPQRVRQPWLVALCVAFGQLQQMASDDAAASASEAGI